MIFNHVSGTLSDLDRRVIEAVPPGGNWRDLPPDFPSKRIEQIRRTAAAGEGSRSTYYGRLQWSRPSYTISTFFSRPGNGCFIHPQASRLITVREAARLQSFPDSYRFFGRGRAPFLQVGNAVPPLLAYQVARLLPRGSFVDLFSGSGGMSLGFELAGHEAVAAADIDEAANETYVRNRGGADEPIALDLGDAGEFRVALKEIKRRAGRSGVDVVAGGPPCQGFSTAGHCRQDDPRNRLVFAFLQAVADLRPKVAVMENVAALAFRRGAAILRTVLLDLANLGYKTDVAVVHAEGYGVPQLRRRCLLIASRDEIAWPAPWCTLMDPGHFRLQPHNDARPRRPVSVRDAIGDLPSREAPTPEAEIAYSREARSLYQSWARSTLVIEDLIPDPAEVPAMGWAVDQIVGGNPPRR